jgi:hypothetical protein
MLKLTIHTVAVGSVVCALGLFCFAEATQAAPINYGDFGPDFPPSGVAYKQVTESSGTDDSPLYGPPTLSGVDLDFDPMGFVATGSDGESDVTDGQLNFTIETLPGAGIEFIYVTEAGDYSLWGVESPTKVAAAMSIRVDILEVDHNPLSSPIDVTADSNKEWSLAVDGAALLAPWSNDLLLEFEPVLAANQIFFELGVTKAEVVIDNFLAATSETDTTAFIAKKDFTIEPKTLGVAIPEPTAMIALAMGGMVISRRRRRR